MSKFRSSASWAVLTALMADTYSDDYERVDVKASYAINDHVQVFAEGQNLTDTKLRQYIGPQRDFITNYERLRRTFYLGASAKW